jgi:hypothetical protein
MRQCDITLRVAVAGDRRRCAASSNRLVYVSGSNYNGKHSEPGEGSQAG